MSQKEILKKLRRYLKAVNYLETGELVSLLKYDHEVKGLKEAGLCFGFTICFSAFHAAGKLKWWQEALEQVMAWDEDKEKLNSEVIVDGKSIKLEKLFERVLNYIVDSNVFQYGEKTPFVPEALTQLNILVPDSDNKDEFKNRFMLFIGDEKEPRKISQHNIVAGNFTPEQLNDLIDDQIDEGTMLIVSSNDHSICLCRDNNMWIVYDSRYQSPEPFYKKFRNKEGAIGEISSCLPVRGIALEAATFSKDKHSYFSAYSNLIEKNPVQILGSSGIHTIANQVPEKLPEILAMVMKQDNGWLSLGRIINTKDEDGRLAFNMLTVHSPASLDMIVENELRSRELYANVTSALFEKSSDGYTSLHILLLLHPDYLTKFLQPDIKQYHAFSRTLHQSRVNEFVKSLSNVSNDGTSFLGTIIDTNPQYLPHIYACIEKSPNANIAICQALAIQNKNSLNGLFMIAKKCPQNMEWTLKFLSRANAGYLLITDTLKQQDENGDTILHILAKNAPELVKIYFDHALQSPDACSALQGVLLIKNFNNESVYKSISDNVPSGNKLVIEFNQQLEQMQTEKAQFRFAQTAESRQDETKITPRQCVLTMENFKWCQDEYNRYKSSLAYNIPGAQWLSTTFTTSAATNKLLTDIPQAKDDAERYQIASAYIKENPDNRFTVYLKRVMTVIERQILDAGIKNVKK